MINAEIKKIFDELEIPFFYMQAENHNHNAYVIFSIFKEQDLGLYSNGDDADYIKTVYYCTLNYWYKTPQDGMKYTEIKKTLKANKVMVRDIVDLPPHNGYYGKSFQLKITRLNEQD